MCLWDLPNFITNIRNSKNNSNKLSSNKLYQSQTFSTKVLVAKVFIIFLKFDPVLLCVRHVTYAFQSEPTLYSCLNVKELLAWSRCEIWRLSDCNWTWTHNHLVFKLTLNHLAKLVKWLSCVVSTHLYGTCDYMSLSCHICVSEWIWVLSVY